jgi:hypothetical protein
MVAHHEEGRHNEQMDSPKKKEKDIQEESADIIELSDIAIGTTADDDLIVELTEEVIDEAMIGISGATRDTFAEGEENLDLSSDGFEKDISFEEIERGVAIERESSQPKDAAEPIAMVSEEVDENISKELDQVFGTEEAHRFEEKAAVSTKAKDWDEIKDSDASISQQNLVDAIEIVIKKLYGDKINLLIGEVVEKIVSQEIKRIKEILTGKAKK